MERLKLSANQIRKIEQIIKDNRATYLEVPSSDEINNALREGRSAMGKVLQENGQVIGEITAKQTYLVRMFWS